MFTVGCTTPVETRPKHSEFLQTIEENGMPDYLIEDNLHFKRILVYDKEAYEFSQTAGKLLTTNEIDMKKLLKK